MPRHRALNEMGERQPKQPKVVKDKKKAEDEETTYMKRISLDFIADVASGCQLPTDDVRKVLQSLRKTLVKQVRAQKKTRIPNVCMIRAKILKARPAKTMVIFGKEKEVKARPEKKKLVCTTLKTFQTDCA